MGLLVLLIFEDDDVLYKMSHEYYYCKRNWDCTYEADKAGGDDKRHASETNETEFPGERDTKDHANDQSRTTLDDTTQIHLSSGSVGDKKEECTYAPRVTPARP